MNSNYNQHINCSDISACIVSVVYDTMPVWSRSHIWYQKSMEHPLKVAMPVSVIFPLWSIHGEGMHCMASGLSSFPWSLVPGPFREGRGTLTCSQWGEGEGYPG